MLETPVVLFIFKRPEATRRVFEAIRKAAPKRLFVIADGSRTESDQESCLSARATVTEHVDWQCELITDFSEINLGCRTRFKSGLDLVFEKADEAIVLEDDCLPDPTFFRFCAELLEKYRDDERIGIISGDNFQFGKNRTGDSYYFSRLLHTWGWATWKRVWHSYDAEMNSWPELRNSEWLKKILSEQEFVEYWTSLFDATYADGSQIWDYQMWYSCWLNDRLNIIPSNNLVTNIGFGEGATHTHDTNPFANLPTRELTFPLSHPVGLKQNMAADRFTLKQLIDIDNPGVIARVRNKVARILSSRLASAWS